MPKSVAYTAWPELRAQLEAAGFVDIERKVFTGAHLFGDPGRLMVGGALHHVSLNVTDVRACVAFYEAMGFREIERPELGFDEAWMRIGKPANFTPGFPPPEAVGHASPSTSTISTRR